MSRKKNRNRSQDASIDLTGNSNLAETGQISSDKSNESNQSDISPAKNGLMSYLKNHWWAVALIAFLTIGAFGAGLKFLDENAKQTIASRNASTPLNQPQETLLSKINPLVPDPTPAPTPQLSKEYIYAGSRLLAVEDANASAAPPADLAIWRPSSGAWWVMGGQGSQQVSQVWGQQDDVPVQGDYDGDGKTDFAIFRPDTINHIGNWYILYSATNSWTQIQWGLDTDFDNLVPSDYDGDGKTDIALWRPANGGWYILKSSDSQALSFQFGSTGDKPAPADYDGDGKADVGVWRNSNSAFYSQNSSNAASQIIGFSQSSAAPVSADYDGDGKADYAIRSGANWIIRNSSSSSMQSPVAWQSSGDTAVQNDYDGDGKVDIAVWKSATGNWYIRQSSKLGQSNEVRQEQWGISGDTPVPAFYKR